MSVFEEAFAHARWKKALREIMKRPEFSDINLTQMGFSTFDEVIIFVYNHCKSVKGIGKLVAYDIAAAICKLNNIKIDKVYIIGNGPKRAVQLLGCKCSKHRVEKGLSLNYVSILDIRTSMFERFGIQLDFGNDNDDADIYESYICNWQKNI